MSYRVVVVRLHSTARLRFLFLFVACVCNGYAKNCTFSRELFDRTGHGSVCIDCAGNRGGPNCDSCKSGFYRLPESKGECLACGCDAVGTFRTPSLVHVRIWSGRCSRLGSESVQCTTDGRCRCKPGVTGEKCNECAPYHYNFGPNGCT